MWDSCFGFLHWEKGSTCEMSQGQLYLLQNIPLQISQLHVRVLTWAVQSGLCFSAQQSSKSKGRFAPPHNVHIASLISQQQGEENTLGNLIWGGKGITALPPSSQFSCNCKEMEGGSWIFSNKCTLQAYLVWVFIWSCFKLKIYFSS